MQPTDGYARMSTALLHEMIDDLKHTRQFVHVNQKERDLDIATVKTLSGLTIDEIKQLARKIGGNTASMSVSYNALSDKSSTVAAKTNLSTKPLP